MPCDPETHDRRSIRLAGYDYQRAAAYFVTVCTEDPRCFFGTIERDRMILNACGRLAAEEWRRTEALRDNVQLDEFVIMPNHVHGIIVIVPPGTEARVDPHGYDLSVEDARESCGGNDAHDGGTDDNDGQTGLCRGAARDEDTNGNDRQISRCRGVARYAPTSESNELRGPKSQSLGAIVRAFKSAVTRRVNRMRGTPGAKVWQRNYYERILRNEHEWRACRRYIAKNPRRWPTDRYHPDR